jgi:hypothetical protein
MSEVTASLLEKIPNSASLFDDRLQKHFDLYVEGGKLLQSEYERSSESKETLRETHPVDWIIGSGANGFGALLKRGNFLFEAPLSFYSKTQAWALSPGYEFGDYGLTAPFSLAALRVIADSQGRSWEEAGGFSNRLSTNWRSAAKTATVLEQRTFTKCRRAIRTRPTRRIPS